MAIKVTLREKKNLANKKSLYLDFYPPIPHPKTGKPTRREFLGLYHCNKNIHIPNPTWSNHENIFKTS